MASCMGADSNREAEPAEVRASERGRSLLEVLLVLATSFTMGALAIALTSSAIDEMRTAVAARYIAGRIGSTRIDAVRRSSAVALRFEAVGDDYMYAPYEDGNGNGVRTAEIHAGIDRPLGPYERLGDKFPGVRFELTPGAPDADGQAGTGSDGVRIGSARMLTMGVDGTATSGTLYVRGRRGQYAVRVLGVTGRTRMLQYLRRGPYMAQPLIDRRADARFGHPVIAGTQAILRPGYAVSLVDLSSGGALIQGPRPLRPGARVHLQLLTGTDGWASRRTCCGAPSPPSIRARASSTAGP